MGIVGIDPEELSCVRKLLRLLRNTDPVVAQLAREAIKYLERVERASSTNPDKANSNQALNRIN